MFYRFWAYAQKVFALPSLLIDIPRDGFSKRYHGPLITTILLVGMLFRNRSLHSLGLVMKGNRKTWKKWLGQSDGPSVSTMARGLRKLNVEALRQMAGTINYKLRRNKVLSTAKMCHGLMVAAVDGHETICSTKRHCSMCRERKKEVKGRMVVEYYHQFVMCQLVLGSIPFIIDMEPVLPGEGEVTASKRMIERILLTNRRMVDVFVFDALYLDSKLLNRLDDAGKYWITVLKQENREAYAEIDRRLPTARSQSWDGKGGKRVKLWDVPDLVGWDGLKKAFRGVVSEERQLVWEIDKGGRKRREENISHWRWLTNMPEIYPARFVYEFGHGRWDIENRGFNELVNQCHLDHAYHHHPNALMAMLWIIVIAFTLSYAFLLRNVKAQLRKTIATRQNLSEQMKQSLSGLNLTAIISFSP